jgi:multiple sugar transport system permease protein
MTATAVVTGPMTAGPEPRARRWTPAPRGVPYAFMVPAAVMFAAVFLVPLGYTVFLSTQRTEVQGLGLGANARKQVFDGFGNYRAVLHNAEFWHSALRALLYGCILIPVMLGLATVFALILDAQRVRFRRLGRIAIFLPYAVPTIIGSLLWGFMYLPSVSPIDSVLHSLFGSGGIDFFAQHTVYLSVANIGVWGGTGFNMMVLYTALRALPQEVYEAARLDGSSELGIALRIKLAMIRPALVVTALFSTIATLQVFNEPYTIHSLSGGAISSTWTPLMTIYHDAYTGQDTYLGSAESIVLAALLFAFSFLVLRLTNRQTFAGESR